MLTLTRILGHAGDPALAASLHHVEHHGGIEFLEVAPQDVGRHRLRLTGDRGTDCAIALARDQQLADGAVLLLEHDRAIVVRLGAQAWLRMRPRDTAAALELGHAAGHPHWRVRFEGEDLLVARDGPAAHYLERLSPLLAAARISVLDGD